MMRRSQMISLVVVLFATSSCFLDEGAEIEAFLNGEALLTGSVGILVLQDACDAEASVIRCLTEERVGPVEVTIGDGSVLERVDVPPEWESTIDWTGAALVRALRPGSSAVSISGSFDDDSVRTGTVVVRVLVPEYLDIDLEFDGPPDCARRDPVRGRTLRNENRAFVGDELRLLPTAMGQDTVRGLGGASDIRLSAGGVFDLPPLISGTGVSHVLTSSTSWAGGYRFETETSIVVEEPGDVQVVPALPGTVGSELTITGVAEADLLGIESFALESLETSSGSVRGFRALPRDSSDTLFCGGERFKRRLTVTSRTPGVCQIRATHDGEGMDSIEPGAAEFFLDFLTRDVCRYELSVPDMLVVSVHEEVYE